MIIHNSDILLSFTEYIEGSDILSDNGTIRYFSVDNNTLETKSLHETMSKF